MFIVALSCTFMPIFGPQLMALMVLEFCIHGQGKVCNNAIPQTARFGGVLR
jgi:hypothetical protein